MSEKELEELRQYNLEYLEALDNENLYDEDYTSAVELKYAKKEIERLYNIIDELERVSYLGMIENTANNDMSKGLNIAYEYINNKVKELKGSDE